MGTKKKLDKRTFYVSANMSFDDDTKLYTNRVKEVALNMGLDKTIANFDAEKLEEAEANANLFCDSLTTYNQCHLLPSELLAKVEALEEMLRNLSREVAFLPTVNTGTANANAKALYYFNHPNQ
jgi:hypothetical protein